MPPRRRNPSRRCKTPSKILDTFQTSLSDDCDAVQPWKKRESEEEDTSRQLGDDASQHSEDAPFSPGNAEPDQLASGPSEDSDIMTDEETEVKRQRSRKKCTPKRKRKRVNEVDAVDSAIEQHPPTREEEKLSGQQMKVLDEVFSVLDIHKNGRITLSDLVRVADEHGFPYSLEEARDMLRFWDSTGTCTVSRDDMTRIAIESKFMKVPTK